MRLLIGLFIFAILLSCSENKQEESKPQHALKEIKPLFDDEIAYENEIRNIDSDKRLTEVTSLEYLSGEGESFVVKGLVETKQDNQVMTLKKLTFKQVFKNGNESTCSYYYIGTRKFASTCEQSILTGNDLKKVLTKSYYNDSSEVFFSKRISGNSENINETSYSACKQVDHDDQLALKIINQEGEFETKFQGFTESMGKNYLILGTHDYTSTVAFAEFNPTLKLLMNNEKKYTGKKLIIDFSVVTEPNGFTFQALTDVKIAH
jgi:hypothetical protein